MHPHAHTQRHTAHSDGWAGKLTLTFGSTCFAKTGVKEDNVEVLASH